jgi:hypothetical protein
MTTTKRIAIAFLAAAAPSLIMAQGLDRTMLGDHATAAVATPDHPLPMHRLDRGSTEGAITGTPYHEVTVTMRCGLATWAQGGCAHPGDIVRQEVTHNMRTITGTNWQYGQMFGTPGAAAVYFGVTPTAVTPAEADTSLSGETTSNGFACASVRCVATATNASGTLTVPSAPAGTVVGTTGSTTYYYFVEACNQLSGTTPICTTPSAASASVTTANATLSTTNYVSVTWTPISGASSYVLLRATSSTAPSGTGSYAVATTASCTSTTCTQLDQSNTLNSVVVPASNLTNFGKMTLVYTWTATATQTINSFGVFTASSAGTMVYEGVLASSYTMNNGDTFQLTETPYF